MPRSPSPCHTTLEFLPPGLLRAEEQQSILQQHLTLRRVSSTPTPPIVESEERSGHSSLSNFLESRRSNYLSDNDVTHPPSRTNTRETLGRRYRTSPIQVSRRLNNAERDRVGFGIPKDPLAPTKRNVIRDLFNVKNISSRSDLDRWYGTRGISRLYDYVKAVCENHWYSHENREAAQSGVRQIIIQLLGRK